MTAQRLAQLMTLALATTLAGCSTLLPSPDRQQAQERWDHVRGRVKFQLAQQHYEAGLFDDTVTVLSESLALDPKRTEAYVLLTRAYLELDRPASAQLAVDAARRSGLESADLMYTEGVILEQRGQLSAALNKYAPAQELDPGNVDYLVASAETLVALGQPQEALALLDKYKNLVDEEATLAVLSAHIATCSGDSADAVKRLRNASIHTNGKGTIAPTLGMLLARSGRPREALAILLPMLEGNDADAFDGEIRRAIATCHLLLNDAEAAREVIEEYARTHADDGLAQLLLAKAAIAVGDAPAALRAIALARRARPNNPEVEVVYATAQWMLGDLAKAATSLHFVLETSPDDVEAHCLMAEVLLAQEKKESAWYHFEQALRINPNCTWASLALQSPG